MANPVFYPFGSAGEITEKSEVYSLGMVLLEASSETTVATSTQCWLVFLLFFFVNCFFCKAKKHFTLCQIFNKPTLKSLPKMSSQIYLSNSHPQNHSNPGYCFFVVRVCCFPVSPTSYLENPFTGWWNVLAESRCLLEGHLPYNIPMERLNTSVGSESPAWNLEDPTECLSTQFSEVPIPAESPSKPSHIASMGRTVYLRINLPYI